MSVVIPDRCLVLQNSHVGQPATLTLTRDGHRRQLPILPISGRPNLAEMPLIPWVNSNQYAVITWDTDVIVSLYCRANERTVTISSELPPLAYFLPGRICPISTDKT